MATARGGSTCFDGRGERGILPSVSWISNSGHEFQGRNIAAFVRQCSWALPLFLQVIWISTWTSCCKRPTRLHGHQLWQPDPLCSPQGGKSFADVPRRHPHLPESESNSVYAWTVCSPSSKPLDLLAPFRELLRPDWCWLYASDFQTLQQAPVWQTSSLAGSYFESRCWTWHPMFGWSWTSFPEDRTTFSPNTAQCSASWRRMGRKMDTHGRLCAGTSWRSSSRTRVLWPIHAAEDLEATVPSPAISGHLGAHHIANGQPGDSTASRSLWIWSLPCSRPYICLHFAWLSRQSSLARPTTLAQPDTLGLIALRGRRVNSSWPSHGLYPTHCDHDAFRVTDSSPVRSGRSSFGCWWISSALWCWHPFGSSAWQTHGPVHLGRTPLDFADHSEAWWSQNGGFFLGWHQPRHCSLQGHHTASGPWDSVAPGVHRCWIGWMCSPDHEWLLRHSDARTFGNCPPALSSRRCRQVGNHAHSLPTALWLLRLHGAWDFTFAWSRKTGSCLIRWEVHSTPAWSSPTWKRSTSWTCRRASQPGDPEAGHSWNHWGPAECQSLGIFEGNCLQATQLFSVAQIRWATEQNQSSGHLQVWHSAQQAQEFQQTQEGPFDSFMDRSRATSTGPCNLLFGRTGDEAAPICWSDPRSFRRGLLLSRWCDPLSQSGKDLGKRPIGLIDHNDHCQWSVGNHDCAAAPIPCTISRHQRTSADSGYIGTAWTEPCGSREWQTDMWSATVANTNFEDLPLQGPMGWRLAKFHWPALQSFACQIPSLDSLQGDWLWRGLPKISLRCRWGFWLFGPRPLEPLMAPNGLQVR